MKRVAFFLLVLTGWIDAQGFYDEKLTTVGNIRATVNNLGMIGNSFNGSYDVLGWASCEYPANSGIEHLFTGGLWIGVLKNGTDKVVATGAIDDPSGYSVGKAGFEYTAELGSKILERSTLLESPNYSADAVSHQDFVADFTSKYAIVPGTNIPIDDIELGPLQADIHFESYVWNYSFADFFVILNFTIKNVGQNVWNDVYLGYWTDPVVRNVNVTPAGSGGSAFYNKGGNGYIDSLYLGYEFDATGDVGFTDSYFGLKFLGCEFNGKFYHPEVDTSFEVNFQTWNFRDFQSVLKSPINDNERYIKLSEGLEDRPEWETTLKPSIQAPSNRSILISAGKIPEIKPGEEVNIVFAVVCAKKKDDGNPTKDDTPAQKYNLIKNASWAQAAYNGEDKNFNGVLDPDEDIDKDGKLTRYILPAPPDIPKVKFIAEDNKVKIYWSNNAEYSIDPISRQMDFEGYRIYKTSIGFDLTETQDVLKALKLVAEFDKEGNNIGYDNGFDAIKLDKPVTFPGDTTVYYYYYEFSNLPNGFQHAFAITAFDRGDTDNNLEQLESSRLTNLFRIFPGKPANKEFQFGKPFVYPNPYYNGAAWEREGISETERRIVFSNLPPHCVVRIYNTAGDLIYSFEHDEDQPQTESTEWYETHSDPEKTIFSGGEHAWNLVSRHNQLIARGLYIFSVTDKETGKTKTGKFVIIR